MNIYQTEELQNDLMQTRGFIVCNFRDFHYINNSGDDKEDGSFNFFAEIMDIIYYHIFHTFDVGLRTQDIKHAIKPE